MIQFSDSISLLDSKNRLELFGATGGHIES